MVKPAGICEAQWVVGQEVRRRRRALDLTQREFARRVGLNRSYVSQMENCRQSMSLVTLARLAAGLHCTMSELVEAVGRPQGGVA